MMRLRFTSILMLCCLALPATAQQWTARTPMSEPRAGMAVAVLGERIFVLGGVDQLGNVLDTALQYDAQNDRWDPLPSMRQERVFAAAVTFDGKVFVMGGLDGDGEVLEDVEFYDPAENRWRSFEDMEQERQGLVAVLRGANLLVAGGSDEDDQILESIELYDGDDWEEFFGQADDGTTTQLGEPRAAFAAVTVGQDVFFMGGFNRGPLDRVERLGADDRFEALEPLPSARGNLAAAVLNDTVYVMGGRDGGDRVLDDVQRFDLTSGSWTAMPRLLERRESCAAAAVNGVLYVIGGRDDTGRVLDSVEALGEETAVGTADEAEERVPFDFLLEPNYPNPFRESTTISFSVTEQGLAHRVRLSVYDLQGRRVAVLVDGMLSPGRHTVTWDGRRRGGQPLGSGVYVYWLQQGALEARRVMAIIR